VRAVTTALNARLIFLMQKLILSVKSVMEHCRIEAPLMIVKGDGSLIGANMALERPIETIMSGPAASVVGAQHLTECDNAFVVDMGGTTTDIAVLKNGKPVINESGSYVDGFRAMVRAVDTCTEGLGGDSEISFDDRNEIGIGPRRVVPLCHLAQEHPSILETLKEQNKLAAIENDDDYGRFLLKQSIFTDKQTGLTSRHREILASLDEGPTALSHLTSKAKYLSIYMDCISDLVDRGLVIFSSFTPTDASNVLGSYDHGSVEASSLGAALSARRTDTEVDEFCRQIRSQVSRLLAHEVINSALYDEGIVNKSDLNGNNLFMVKRALRNNSLHNFSVSLTMNRPLVAIGAPVETYMPRTASLLNGDFVIPEHAEVANAIGAVSGGILQMVKILIKPLDEGRIFRVFLPEGVTDFRDYDKALQLARKTAGAEAEKYALQAGAKEVKTQLSVDENFLKAKRENETVEILFESEISATAFGRPHLGK
ncbi:MAG: hypothetical protein GY866_19950, partial [Proteobacteria bacterium]|nr:hypothetical protein [Pseudomonadota bacterium]